jgi:hypothetical protein
MRIGHVAGIFVSGILWLIIGCFLTFKGVVFLGLTILSEKMDPLMQLLMKISSNRERAGLVLIFSALVIGLFKGRVVLAKTVMRQVKRLMGISHPLHLKDLFPLSYLAIIGSMMMLGMLLKFLPITHDIRGFIDLAVGSALINGAFLYFKQAILLKAEIVRRKS